MTTHTHSVAKGRLMLLVLATVLLISNAYGQTTAFTYQGKLVDSGNLANAAYDMQFKLFDAPTNGNQIGATLTFDGTGGNPPSVSVTNGIFTVNLDFGSAAFSGADRFLEVSLRPAGNPGGYQQLLPRQKLTSAPYAIKSQDAATADGLSVACVNCVNSSQIQSVNGRAVTGTIPVASVPAGSANYVQNSTSQQTSSNFNISGNGTAGGTLSGGNLITNGSVGIGTSSFLRPPSLQLGASPSAAFTISPSSGLPNAGYIRFGDNTGWKLHVARSRESSGGILNTDTTGALMTIQDNGNVGIGNTTPAFRLDVINPGNAGLRVITNTSGGTLASFGGFGDFQIDAVNVIGGRMTLKEAGNVGIGTASPQAKLDVRGNVKLGNSGEFFASSGEENLRIVRGFVDRSGNILEGAGFTVERIGAGDYRVTLSRAFLGLPTVTANCVILGGSDPPCFIHIYFPFNNVAEMGAYDINGNLVDSAFSFIAIGAR